MGDFTFDGQGRLNLHGRIENLHNNKAFNGAKLVRSCYLIRNFSPSLDKFGTFGHKKSSFLNICYFCFRKRKPNILKACKT